MITLVDALERNADAAPGHGFTFVDSLHEPEVISFSRLRADAMEIAAGLIELGVHGEPVLIACPHDGSYVRALFACLYAGAIAVPAFSPKRPRQISRLKAIIADCRPKIALTTLSELKTIESRTGRMDQSCQWLPIETLRQDGAVENRSRGDPNDIAYLQYTSGSTGHPKGAMISNTNIDANCVMLNAFATDDDIVTAWVPFFHDMGLVGSVLKVVHGGLRAVLMPPAQFIQKPVRWLQIITDYRATTSGAPNFAYDLCVEKITAEQRSYLDLSSWRRTWNGAEPVRESTVKAFEAAFRECGFSADKHWPCYGMAETTLMVCANDRITDPRSLARLDTAALKRNEAVEAGSAAISTTFVGCGVPAPHHVRIVDPETLDRLPPRRVGEIWLAGEHVSSGYWSDRLTGGSQAFSAVTSNGEGPYLRSGDLGFLDEHGGLFITGRLKDLIILNGSNFHAVDIEAAARTVDPVLAGQASAAFQTEGGKVVLCQEVARAAVGSVDVGELREKIIARIAADHDLFLGDVLLVKPGTVPRTSSSKVQRAACRDAYEEGSIFALSGKQRTQVSAGSNETLSAIVECVSRVMGISDETVSPATTFADMGFDSLKATEAAPRLERMLGRRISPTLFYDYPTPIALARHLCEPDGRIARWSSGTRQQSEIAIVGIGCRFPDAAGPAQFWERLLSRHNAVREMKFGDRWQDLPTGPTPEAAPSIRWRAPLEEIDAFDAQFFGISPREASEIDPQQRILLEVAWEALEHAAIPAKGLAGSRTGVFVGISGNDYAQGIRSCDPAMGLHPATGNALSIASNRLSYTFDFRGPSISIDTACSSSLVAVHQACQSIRSGECTLALAGGVNVILSSQASEAFAAAGMLSSDGRCHTFDARANGYVRGEGCGIVVLKALEDAVSDGDRILAVIAGSAVNQDGRSNGLTAPNGEAQEEVIRTALAGAGIDANRLGMIEAHGTGTPLGDPIEFDALRRVTAQRLDANAPCFVGSVKGNLGHLEAAAGIAGLIKATLSLQEGVIPAQAGFDKPNPLLEVDAAGCLQIATQEIEWGRSDEPRVAGVSSFGFGGTNAHIVLKEAPAELGQSAQQATADILCVSASTQPALRELAGSYAASLSGELSDICRSANAGRSHLEFRAAFVANDVIELREQLGSFSSAPPATPAPRAKLAFLFAGQGQAFVGAGESLFHSSDVFRSTMIECDQYFSEDLGLSVLAHMYGTKDEEPSHDTLVAQPCLFSVGLSLARFWTSVGVRPDLIVAHSLGEYVAACFADVLSTRDAVRLVAARARLMSGLTEKGAMAAVFAPATKIQRHLACFPELSIAAYNGENILSVSGSESALLAMLANLDAANIRSARLDVSHAFHSRLMRPILDAFRSIARDVEYRDAKIPIASNLTGEVSRDCFADPEYWVSHLQQPVRFQAGFEALRAAGANCFVEIGTGSTLLSLGRRMAPEDTCSWLPSFNSSGDGVWRETLARLYERGIDPIWSALPGVGHGRIVDLPSYPFQRQSHWRAVVERATAKPEETPLLSIEWQPSDVAAVASSMTGPFVVSGAKHSIAGELASRLPGAIHVAQAHEVGERIVGRTVRGVVYVLASSSARASQIESDTTDDLHAIAKIIEIFENLPAPPKIWIVGDEADPEAWLAAGFAQTLALEHPNLWGGCNLFGDGTSVEQIATAILQPSGDTLDLLRDGRRWSRRLTETRSVRGTAGPAIRGSAVITGGYGALGLATAQWLTTQGCRSITLIGRQGPSSVAKREISRLRRTGAEIRVVKADVTDEAAMQEVIRSCDELTWLVHAAGCASFTELRKLDAAEIERVLRPKRDGARNLDLLLDGADVNLIMYSSIASVWGSAGQAHYAAANSYLDGLAHRRRARGQPTVCVNWGPWTTGTGSIAHRQRLAEIGLRSFEPERAAAFFPAIFAMDHTQIVAVDADWTRFRPIYEANGTRRLLERLGGRHAPEQVTATSTILEELDSTPEADRPYRLVGYLNDQARTILGLKPGDALAAGHSLVSLGLDSLMAVELQRRVARDLRCECRPTLVFDYPTTEAMAEHLLDEVLRFARSQPDDPDVKRGWLRQRDPAPGSLSDEIERELQKLNNVLRVK